MTPAHLAAAGALLYGERWQSELSRALGYRQETVNRWATGKRPISERAASAIADLMRDRGVRIAEWLDGRA